MKKNYDNHKEGSRLSADFVNYFRSPKPVDKPSK